MSYHSDLTVTEPYQPHPRPALKVPANAVTTSNYRVGYWQKVGDKPAYEYYLTDSEARKRFRQIRDRGLFGVVQRWNSREEKWIG